MCNDPTWPWSCCCVATVNSWSGQHPYEWHCGTHTPREEYEDQGVPPAWPSQHPDQWVSSVIPQPVIPRPLKATPCCFIYALILYFQKIIFQFAHLYLGERLSLLRHSATSGPGVVLYNFGRLPGTLSWEHAVQSHVGCLLFYIFFFFAAVPKIWGHHASQILFPVPS